MSGGGGCNYHVIQFLEVPYKDIADFVCVPTSWVQSCRSGVPIVKVSYPVEEPSLTEQRVKNRNGKSDSWKSYLSVVRHNSDNYENAKIYIQQEINNSKKHKADSNVDAKSIQDRINKSEKKNGDHSLLSVTANKKTSISTQNATSRATIDNDAFVVGMLNALGWCVSSKSTNTITLKRKARPDPDKEKNNKRFRVNESDESDNQTAGPSSKALDWSNKNHLSLTPEDSDEDPCTQETPVKKFKDNITEMRQTDNQNPTKTTYSLDPKTIAKIATSPTFAKWSMLMQELQEVFDNSMFRELINKLLNKDTDGSAPQNNDPIASPSSDTTVAAPKLNQEKKNEKPAEEKDTDDDGKDQPLKKNSCPKRMKNVVLLPVNDAKRSEKSHSDDSEGVYQPAKKTSSPNRIKEAVLPLVNDVNHSEKSDSDDSEHDLQPPKKTSSPKQIKKAVLPPVNDVNHSEPLSSEDNDKDQPLKKKSCPIQIKKINLQAAYDDRSESELDLEDDEELPPEYDANDTRWTLKYREPAPGLVELIPGTGVYVANFTSNPLKFATLNPLALAIKLLSAIFTKKALCVCTLTDIRAKAIDRGGTYVRPVLDEHAVTVLINYVTDHAKKVGGPKVGIRRILKSMRNSMQDIYYTAVAITEVLVYFVLPWLEN